MEYREKTEQSQLTNAPDVVRQHVTTAGDIFKLMQAEVAKEKAKQAERDHIWEVLREAIPKWLLDMPKDGPGFLVGTGATHGVAPETIYLGYAEGHGIWRQDYGAPLRLPPMFSAEIVGKKTLKIKDGIVRWSTLTLLTNVRYEDPGTLTGGYFTLDMTAWTADEYRYAYMELDLSASYAYFRVTADESVPEDEPNNLIVRWPLVKMLGTGSGADFRATIEDVCHEGIIKITAIIGPPIA